MDTWWETNKEQLRSRAKQTLVALSLENKKQQNITICTALEKYLTKYKTWAVFIPFGYEPDIFPFVQQFWEQNKTVLVPQINDNWLRLAYYNADSIISEWIYGEWIIKNPVWYEWSIDVCLVPWLVFDRQWRRIGHGKWYYDKFLAKNTCYRIGVGYKEIMRENIPHDNFDQKMDTVIS